MCLAPIASYFSSLQKKSVTTSFTRLTYGQSICTLSLRLTIREDLMRSKRTTVWICYRRRYESLSCKRVLCLYISLCERLFFMIDILIYRSNIIRIKRYPILNLSTERCWRFKRFIWLETYYGVLQTFIFRSISIEFSVKFKVSHLNSYQRILWFLKSNESFNFLKFNQCQLTFPVLNNLLMHSSCILCA